MPLRQNWHLFKQAIHYHLTQKRADGLLCCPTCPTYTWEANHSCVGSFYTQHWVILIQFLPLSVEILIGSAAKSHVLF